MKFFRHIQIIAAALVLTIAALPARAGQSYLDNFVAFFHDHALYVQYDLVADKPMPVWLLASVNGGATWSKLTVTVSGDIGPAVDPGETREIKWRYTLDEVSENDLENLLVKVIIDGQLVRLYQELEGAWREMDNADYEADKAMALLAEAQRSLRIAERKASKAAERRMDTDKYPGSDSRDGQIIIVFDEDDIEEELERREKVEEYYDDLNKDFERKLRREKEAEAKADEAARDLMRLTRESDAAEVEYKKRISDYNRTRDLLVKYLRNF